jgi:hypothetical protein
MAFDRRINELMQLGERQFRELPADFFAHAEDGAVGVNILTACKFGWKPVPTSVDLPPLILTIPFVGAVTRERIFEVDLPPGTADGSRTSPTAQGKHYQGPNVH